MKANVGMKVKKKPMMYGKRGMKVKMMPGGGKMTEMFMAGGKLKMMSYEKGGKSKKKVMIPAPEGHHWMDMDGRFFLMAHEGEFKPHKGAMLEAPFELITKHSG